MEISTLERRSFGDKRMLGFFKAIGCPILTLLDGYHGARKQKWLPIEILLCLLMRSNKIT